MKPYLVIGLYNDTGQVFLCSTEAADPHEAMSDVAWSYRSHEGNLDILCAIESLIPFSQVTCACEDSGKAADVADLWLPGR